MIYAYKQLSIANANTPQPAVFTTLTVAFNPLSVGGGPSTISVADTSFFKKSDQLWVDSGASAELAKIDSIISGTSMVVETIITNPVFPSAQGLQNAHASGAFVSLRQRFMALTVQNILGGNSGTIYVFSWPNAYQALASYGRDSLQPSTSAPYPGLVGTIPAGGGSVGISNVWGANSEVTDPIWLAGTSAGDHYFVELTQL